MKGAPNVRVEVPEKRFTALAALRISSPITPVFTKVFKPKSDVDPKRDIQEDSGTPRSHADRKARSLQRIAASVNAEVSSPRELHKKNGKSPFHRVSGMLLGDPASPRETGTKTGALILRRFAAKSNHNSDPNLKINLQADPNAEPARLPDTLTSPRKGGDVSAALLAALDSLESGTGTCDALIMAMFNLTQRLEDEKLYRRIFRILKAPSNLRAVIRLVCNTNEYNDSKDIHDIRMRYSHHYVVRLLFQQDPEEFRSRLVSDAECMNLILLCFKNPSAPAPCIHTCTAILLTVMGPFQTKVFEHVNSHPAFEMCTALLQHVHLGLVQHFCATLFSTNVKGLIELASVNVLKIMQHQFTQAASVANDPDAESSTTARAVALVENTSCLFREFATKIIFTGRVPIRPETKPTDYAVRLNDALDNLDAIRNPESALEMLNTGIQHALRPPDQAIAAPLVLAAGVRMINNIYNAFFHALVVEDPKVRSIAEARSIEAMEQGFLNKIPHLAEIFTRLVGEGHGLRNERIGVVGETVEGLLALYTTLFEKGSKITASSLMESRVPQRSLELFRKWPCTTTLHRRVVELVQSVTKSKVRTEVPTTDIPMRLLELRQEVRGSDCSQFVEACIAAFGGLSLQGYTDEFTEESEQSLSKLTARAKQTLFREDIPERPDNVEGGEAAALFELSKVGE